MEAFFTLDNLVTFALLVLLQAVLGVDNLLSISQISKQAPLTQQKIFQRYGLIMTIVLRIVLLFVVVKTIALFQQPLFSLDWHNVISADFTLQSVIFLAGGIMIMYTATKEMTHLLLIDEIDRVTNNKNKRSKKNQKSRHFSLCAGH